MIRRRFGVDCSKRLFQLQHSIHHLFGGSSMDSLKTAVASFASSAPGDVITSTATQLAAQSSLPSAGFRWVLQQECCGRSRKKKSPPARRKNRKLWRECVWALKKLTRFCFQLQIWFRGSWTHGRFSGRRRCYGPTAWISSSFAMMSPMIYVEIQAMVQRCLSSRCGVF